MEQDKNVIKGKYHEKDFAEYLNNNNIPYLFITQSSLENPKSIVLKDANAQRPDFLVYLQEIGHIFIDVKSRYTIEDLDNQEVHYFYIDLEQIDSLYSLYLKLKLPLWIAFRSTNKKDDKDFNFLPITILKEYEECVKKELTNNTILESLFLRIPNQLFYNKNNINNLIKEYNFDKINNIKDDVKKYLNIEKELEKIYVDLKDKGISSGDEIQEYCINNKITYVNVEEIKRYNDIKNK